MKHAISIVAMSFTLFATVVPAAADVTRHPVGTTNTETGAPVSAYGPDVPLAYYGLAFQFVKRTAGFTPPVESRAYAYMGLALYESLVGGMPHYRSIARQLNGIGPLPEATGAPYHWPLVASAALAEVMRGLWGGSTNAAAANIADLNALEAQIETENADVPFGLRKRSIEFGREMGAAVFETSKDDGENEGYNNAQPYTPPVGPGLWVPTSPTVKAVQPYWGTTMTTFALLTAAECDPGSPLSYSEDPSSDFYADAYQTYQAGKNLTAEQLTIARFWAAVSGPGHSLSIASQIIVQEGATLDKAAETYGRVGIAVGDAITAVWYAKYTYNLLRPITYIRRVIDPSWSPALTTPAFPEYVSAHSSQSAAAATILETMYGENVAFVDHSDDAAGFAPRSFNRIYAAAEEAGISRIYGGIHFPTGNLHGQQQGRCVAGIVNGLAWRR